MYPLAACTIFPIFWEKSRSEQNKYTTVVNSSWGISEQNMRKINFSSICHNFVISLGLRGHSLKRLKSCVNLSYSFADVGALYKSFFSYENRLNRSQLCNVIYKANWRDCNDFYNERRNEDHYGITGETEHFKALPKCDHFSAIASHVKTTSHSIKWDRFDILANLITIVRLGRSCLFRSSSQH